MNRKQVVGCLAAFGLALAGGASALGSNTEPTGAQAFKAAQQRIQAQRKTETKACGRLKENAAEVCGAEANARAALAMAQLEAQREPGPDADHAVKNARAEAGYKVARERCDAAPKATRKACIAQAKDTRDAGLRQADVEKVQQELRLKAAGRREGQGQPAKTPEERYAAQKAYCGLQGIEREHCLAEVNRRFHKS
ncbi:hypothetical protein [Ramlibacter sp.]|uniref:hypothetical protein n=1 Tax=Ramlibacter sp. TaxID=1917967 RepID=UPI00180239C0|nr:hypothetical protein [Ramlibacter sp.]MBA2675627.1 hypothetical protein [Ramlibacter sp.]